jgi:uncharacterized delta-60 repeat protein
MTQSPATACHASRPVRPFLALAVALGLFGLTARGAVAAPGSLDKSFGTNGIATPKLKIQLQTVGGALQSDGRIVIAGENGSLNDFIVVRLTSHGKLDPTFGKGGVARVDLGGQEIPAGIAVQPGDDKILVVGSSGNYAAIVRLTAKGQIDTTFNGTGFHILDAGIGFSAFHSVLAQTDGRIVTVGAVIGSASFLVTRFNEDGTLDASFSGDGIATVPFSGTTEASSVALQSDDSYVVAGFAGGLSQIGIVRLTPGGDLDSSFGGTGKVVVGGFFGNFINGLAVRPGDKPILAGLASQHFGLFALNNDGSTDTSFDGDGREITPLTNGGDAAASVAVQDDGKLLLAGDADALGAPFAIGLARYATDGSLDATFGKSGIVVTRLKTPSLTASSVLRSPGAGSNTIVVVGTFAGRTRTGVAAARYKIN